MTRNRSRLRCVHRLVPLLAMLAGVSPSSAQEAPGAGSAQPARLPLWATLVTSGGLAEDRLRMSQLRGESSTAGALIRSASGGLAWGGDDGPRLEWRLLRPEIQAIRNSELPVTQNDGALWAGRGTSAQARVGAALRYGRVTAVLAPEFRYEENDPYQVFPYPEWRHPRRNEFAAPWFFPPQSLDYPLRFGAESRSGISPGQSSLSVEAGPVAVGAATENLWWGPGIRNAIVMSSNAAGIPHLFLRTARPLATRLGTIEGRWIVGELRESDFFDSRSENDARSLSAVAIALTPAGEPGLTLGLTRAVYAARSVGVGTAFDVLRGVSLPDSLPADSVDAPAGGRDQIFSLFGRWIFPRSGLEVYGEWARFEQPRSLRDFLTDPGHSQAYTAGLQWLRPLASRSALRLQAEATNLELSPSYRYRRVYGSYASPVVAHGYTHRGQVIGAAIGPGSSSQWLAADYVAPAWQVGAFAGRVRWHNTAYYSTAATENTRWGHDVSVLGGLRAGVVRGPLTIAAEFEAAQRINYLFQTFFRFDEEVRSVNLRNDALRLTVSAAPW